MQVLGVIKRNFVLTDEEDFRLLFNGFVRPHLEYCVSVWSPYLVKDIECLEIVQCRAITLVQGLKYKQYDERLKLLGITSLQKRRNTVDLIQVFIIVKGFDTVDFGTFFELDNGGGHALRGHNWKLKVKVSGIFVPKTIRSLEHSFPGPLVPWNFCSRGPFVPKIYTKQITTKAR